MTADPRPARARPFGLSPQVSSLGGAPLPAEDRLLDEALALPAAARAAWLEARAAAGDPEALARVAAALAEAEADDGFLAPAGALRGELFDAFRRDVVEAAEAPSLRPGELFGAYLVVERVGVGGMGEVYRARDTRLGRDVALKVLPSGLGQHPGWRARLRREARLLAALNHPSIAAIHELEEHGGTAALVMEFVEGETLAERLASGPIDALTVVAIGRQLLDALAAARARGIVHRDLKPANITLTADGRVKVLDFGIATVLGGGDPEFSDPWVPASTSEPAVRAAAGTAAYMSPEQVRDGRADHRADMWALGCVLYEALTGHRAFDGDTTPEVLARVLDDDPDFRRLPRDASPALRMLIAHCLQKETARRLEDLGHARALLAGDELTVPRRPRLGASPVLLGLTVGLIAAGMTWLLSSGRQEGPVARLTVPIPVTDELVTGAEPALALTPDGRTVVYRARRDGTLTLFRRSLDNEAPTRLPGTVNASGPFLSPDGRWVGFERDGALMKVPLTGGGPPVQIAETGSGGATATWSDRGEIVFAPARGRGLYRVSANGGTPAPLTAVSEARREVAHAFPHALPGGHAVLFTVVTHDGSHVGVVRLDGGAMERIADGRQPQFVPTGHLLFLRGDALWAVRFDAERLRPRGAAAPVLQGLDVTSTAHYAVAANGSLLYVPPRNLEPPRSLVWIGRDGTAEPAAVPPRRWTRSSLSPDGTRVALVVSEGGTQSLWVHDLAGRTSRRLTAASGTDTAPVWAPDGRSIVFRSDGSGGGLFRVSADGRGTPERLTTADGTLHTPYAFTPDGATLLYTEFRNYADQGIGALALAGDRRGRLIIDDPAHADLRPALSPDGRWVAYQSDRSGRFEVYVRPYPDVRARVWQASDSGGTSPQWSPDGRELFYCDGRGIVSLRTARGAGGAPLGTERHRLFDAAPFTGRLGPVYSVSPDGQRFLFIEERPERESAAARRQLRLVQNWTTELAARLAQPPTATR